MIHGVLSCGLTETQYSSFCQAANIGSEGEKTFDTGNSYPVAHMHVYNNVALPLGAKHTSGMLVLGTNPFVALSGQSNKSITQIVTKEITSSLVVYNKVFFLFIPCC